MYIYCIYIYASTYSYSLSLVVLYNCTVKLYFSRNLSPYEIAQSNQSAGPVRFFDILLNKYIPAG
jgi:hypothetical protein